jgi:hypothetical protein
MTDTQHEREQHVSPAEVAAAMAVYSADGQVDDETGGDAAAEQLRAQQPSLGQPGPDEDAASPESGHIGPA